MNHLSTKITQLLSIVTPVMATDNLELNPGSNSTFQPLTNVTAGSIISGAISLVLVVVVVVFFFMLVLGGFKYLTSGGDEKKLTAAKGQLTGAFVGLIIIFSSWAILNLIQVIFGIDILSKGLSIPSFNPTTIEESTTIIKQPVLLKQNNDSIDYTNDSIHYIKE